MKKPIAFFLSISLIATFVVTAEPAKSPKQAHQVIQYRQALFKLIKSNVGVLGGMAKGAIPYDQGVIETNATRIEQLSLMLEDYFATDTSSFDIETSALNKIWLNEKDFKQKIDGLTKAAANLRRVAKAADESQFKPAISQIFKTCKSCHKGYREK